MAQNDVIFPDSLNVENAEALPPVLLDDITWYGIDFDLFPEGPTAADPALCADGVTPMVLPPILAPPIDMESVAPAVPPSIPSSGKIKHLKHFMYAKPPIKYEAGLCTVKACLRRYTPGFRRCEPCRMHISLAKKKERSTKADK